MDTLQTARHSIEYVATDCLVDFPHNARKHPKRQLEKLAASMREFSFTSPISVDPNNNVIAGHGRLEAAKMAGLAQVPVICFRHLTRAQIQAYMLADNRLAELTEWDDAALAIQLQTFIDLDSGFDITITGFEIPEIDLILQEAATPAPPEEVLEPPPSGPPVSRLGDIFALGEHKVGCGSSLEGERGTP